MEADRGMAAMPEMLPAIVPETEDESRSGLEPGYLVICWNDPVNYMEYVTHVFRTVFGWPRKKAEFHMLHVHEQGNLPLGIPVEPRRFRGRVDRDGDRLPVVGQSLPELLGQERHDGVQQPQHPLEHVQHDGPGPVRLRGGRQGQEGGLGHLEPVCYDGLRSTMPQLFL